MPITMTIFIKIKNDVYPIKINNHFTIKPLDDILILLTIID